MMLSNSSDFTGAIWETYSTTKNWTLLTGDGYKLVYVKVKYSDNNESAIVKDSILPQPLTNLTIIIANGADYTSTRNVEITHSIIGDSLKMKISEDSTFSGINWQIFSSPISFQLSTGDGVKTVYAIIKNDFEIESQLVSDDILPQPMNPSIIIQGGDRYTSNRNIELTYAIAGSNLQMKVSEDSTFTGQNWQSFNTPINFELSTPEGLKTIYGVFKNDFEIESQIVQQSITLDMSPPIPVLIVTPDSGITNETIFQLDPTGSYDNIFFSDSIRVRYDWENDGGWDTDWAPLLIIDKIYSLGGGSKSLKMELIDGVGLMSDTTINVFINTRPNALFITRQDSTIETKIYFDGSGSSDFEDGDNLHFRWDFDGDGNYETNWLSDDTISYNYFSIGEYNAILHVRDLSNLTSEIMQQIKVYPLCNDIDGNNYKVVKIGSQYWMAENLKVTHYNNGGAIPHVTDTTQWTNITSGAYCNYDNNIINVETYGRLYNWYAVDDTRNIAPQGWHVPNDIEWHELLNYFGGQSVAGGKMKETGLLHWSPPNTGATNESGFTALPGGGRYNNFFSLKNTAYFWSSTSIHSAAASYAILFHDRIDLIMPFDPKTLGMSIRCVRD